MLSTVTRALPRHLWALAALTLLAAVLRFSTLGMQSFWSDETVTVLLVRMDFSDMLTMLSKSESTPPLYYVLGWPWTRAFGSDEIGLRSLSALAGTAAVPIAFAAASILVSRRAAVATAAVVAVNPLLVWYSQEARAYALLVTLVALSFLLFVRALQDPTPGRLAAWSAASILALASHYFAAFAIVPAAFVLLVVRPGRAALALAATLLGAAVLAPLALAQRGTGSAEWISRSPLDERIVILVKQLLVGRNTPLDRPLAVAAALLVLAALVLLVLRGCQRNRRGAVVAAAVGLAALAAPVGLALLGFDYVITQSALAAFIPLAVAGSAGFAVRVPRGIGSLALASLCALSIVLVATVSLEPTYHRADWRGAARAVGQADGNRIIVIDNDFGGWFARIPFQLYLPEARAVDRGLATVPQRFPLRLRRREQDHAAPSNVATREIVFVNFTGESACGIASPRLFGSFHLVEKRISAGYSLHRYRSREPVAVAPRAIASGCLRSREVAILVQDV